MNLLAVDASSENISLCIRHNGRIVVDFNRRIKFGASMLIEYIEKNLKKLILKPKDFNAFVIGSGPGSFTGLRISFSIIKAFAIATKQPIIAVPSFFSCAYQAKNKNSKIAVISDAKKNLINFACFVNKNGNLKLNSKNKLVTPQEFKDKKGHLFVTHDAALRKRLIEDNPCMNFYTKDIYPKAKDLLLLAQSYYTKNKFVSIEKLEPLYLHPKTCQIRRKNS